MFLGTTWHHSLDHDEPCRLVGKESAFGEETALVWLPRRDAVVRVAASRLRPIREVGASGLDHVSYVSAAVCIVDALKQDTLMTHLDSRRGWSKEQLENYNWERFDDLVSAGWDLVIIDELHYFGRSADDVTRYNLKKVEAASKHGRTSYPHVERLLRNMEGEQLRSGRQDRVVVMDRMYFCIKFLQPALDADLIKMTIPDKARSSKQEHRLTDAGRTFLASIQGKHS